MKEYMIVCRGDWKKWDDLPDKGWDQVMDDFGKWVGDLKKKDLYGRGDQLSKQYKTLKKVNNELNITDGPFTESKESLTGFFLIRAESLEQAADLAQGHPSLLFDQLDIYEIPK